VIEGHSSVDESLITGDRCRWKSTLGTRSLAAQSMGTGSIVMSAERVGAETLLARIVHMVAEAQRTRAPIQALATAYRRISFRRLSDRHRCISSHGRRSVRRRR
jgi:Cu+-exporting ATPase